MRTISSTSSVVPGRTEAIAIVLAYTTPRAIGSAPCAWTTRQRRTLGLAEPIPATRGTKSSDSRLEAEQRFQADGEAGVVQHVPNAHQHPGHERGTTQRVVSNGQRLALGAEQHLLVRDQPSGPHRVHPYPLDRRATSARQLLGGGVRHSCTASLSAGGGDERGGVGGGPGRRVHFAGVVKLDYLGVVEEPGSLPGEVHGQHGADAEVG